MAVAIAAPEFRGRTPGTANSGEKSIDPVLPEISDDEARTLSLGFGCRGGCDQRGTSFHTLPVLPTGIPSAVVSR